MMKKLLISLVLISLLVTSTVMVAIAQEPTVEPTEEPTVEPTEEPTVEPTEEPTVEPTEEPTVEPTEEPTMGAQGDIGAQAYAGTWTTYVIVQNAGTSNADIGIDWIPNGAISPCDTTFDTGLRPGESRRYDPSTAGTCDDNWLGSAMVASGDAPIVAIAEHRGSLGQLLSEYSGSSEPSTEVLIIPQSNTTVWDPLFGIFNAGSSTANVTIIFLDRDGNPVGSFPDTIPPLSAVQHRAMDLIGDGWQGSIRIEQTGTPQPLYAVNKAEREITMGGMLYPVSIAYEGWKVSDAKDNFLLPVIVKRMSGLTGFPVGQNTTVGLINPNAGAVDVTIRWFANDGTEYTPTTINGLPGNGTQYLTTRDDLPQLPNQFTGYAKVGSTGGPVMVLVHTWVAIDGAVRYKSWAVHAAVDPAVATSAVYIPAFYKQSSGGVRVGAGWCTSASVVNLSETLTTTVEIEMVQANTGTTYTRQATIPPEGKVNWYTLNASLDSLGINFFGGAKIRVTSGPGPIIGMGVQTGGLYGDGVTVTGDAYGFYNGINQ